MKFGACCSSDIERVRILKKLGYDYAEGGCGAIASLTDNEFEKYFSEFKSINLPMPAQDLKAVKKKLKNILICFLKEQIYSEYKK